MYTEHIELLNNFFDDELGFILTKEFEAPLYDMVCVLVLDKFDYVTIPKFGNQ